jgi:hypothetical protein
VRVEAEGDADAFAATQLRLQQLEVRRLMRLRYGNLNGDGSTLGSYSDTIRNRSAISRASDACAAG